MEDIRYTIRKAHNQVYPGPQAGGYPPPQGGGYPPPQGGGYPPHGGAPPPQGGGYPPPQGGGYPPPQGGGYPPHGGAPPQVAGRYPPPQGGGYPPHGGAPPPGAGGYPPHGGAPPPGAGGYPPHGGAPPQFPQAAPDGWQRPPPPPKNDDGESGPSEDEDDGPPGEATGITISGYENVGAYGSYAPAAPPPMARQEEVQAPHMEFANVANLDEAQCREAVLEYVAQHCCYGKGCAEKHVANKIEPSTALRYVLETYTEGRKTGRTYDPYCGGFVDGPENGTPPQPWDMACQPNELFVDEVKEIEVPHTAYVKTCERCGGCGQVRCCSCGGRGNKRCGSCGGDGQVRRHNQDGYYDARCGSCGGDGRRRCGRCGGDGRVTCPRCQGQGRLRWYIELTVTYTNNKVDHILEQTDMPDELVRDVSSISIFEQTHYQVPPIMHYPVPEIASNSVKLVDSHRIAFPGQRQLQQRQSLLAVPVTEIHFTWKDMQDRYWVYGTDRAVYFPSYPQTCCWGCQIL